MRKLFLLWVAIFAAQVFSTASFAQAVRLTGNVMSGVNKESISAVSVVVKGTSEGTYTDGKGNFSLSVKSLPATLVISSVGYSATEIVVSNASQVLSIVLNPSNVLGEEVVVAASLAPERILKSPVSIERVNSGFIRNAPAASFYDVLQNLKGVDITTSSLTFKTPTTRGFGGSGNTRFNQIMDGMDNQAPGLNFSAGAIFGINELDVDNMELLPGASSALYGPGGMNGTLLINSKNPFKYQGLSFQVKTGIMHTDESERPASPYYNWNLRWAQKVSERFAFKINAEMIQAKDWIGMDYRNYDRSSAKLKPGTRATDPGYDGVNVYGDETFADLRLVLNSIAQQAPFLGGFISTLSQNPIIVSRTGYTEQELMDPNTVNVKLGGSLHYKINSNTEMILAGYWGTGNTIYTGASRYSLLDFKMGQYKLEVKNKNWVLRAYTTQENAGNAYNLAATTQNFNEAWKPSGGATGWYSQYGQTWLGAKLNGLSDYDAHALARAKADSGRPVLGSAEFKSLYDGIRKLPVPQGGALLDRSDLYMVEGNYNLSEYTKGFADVIVGGNYRRYSLNSQGTLFADSTDPIAISEFGLFAQASKELTDKLKVTASGRYDKNENFKGRFTPRVTAVYTLKDNNNIRLSYQTAYRFPSNQQQFINLDLVSYKLIGGNKIFNDIYNFDENPIYYRDSLRRGVISRRDFATLKPEAISSLEAGYRGLYQEGKMLVDMYAYYGRFSNFLARTIVAQSKTAAPITLADTLNGNFFSIPVNSTEKINTYGFGLSIDYKFYKNFMVGVNLASDNISNVPADLIAGFNSPKYKFNGSISNSGFGPKNRLGFNVTYRWQDGFYYEGDLASGNVPAINILDAQISYKLPVKKCMLKLGANNLLNQYYYNAIGNSRIGGLYYFSFGYNVF